MNPSFSSKKPSVEFLPAMMAAIVLLVAATPALADWPNTNATKWVQYPNTNITGYDVLMGRPHVLADDFLCTNTGPITDIHLWTSFTNDIVLTNLTFTMNIWSDFPAGYLGTNYSRPGSNLWSGSFVPGQYAVVMWVTNVIENYWNPDLGTNGILGQDHAIWQYNFYPTNPFVQQGTPQSPTVYWLSVSVGPSGPARTIGWKTSTNHWNDDAVYGHASPTGVPFGDWLEMRDPSNPAVSLDLSFALTTTNPPPPGTNTVIDKWLQIPDTSPNGLDVKATDPKVLADDFRCNATGPITQIRIWTSWRFDLLPPTPPCFNLGIWSDIPAITNSPFYSRPGQQLCNWQFLPGQYTYSLYTNGVNEQFFDPNIPAIIGFDTMIWEYVFDIPTNQACIQTNGNIYWLSVTADCFDTNQFLFGWKTCPTNWNDDAVFGDAPFFGAPPPFWMELRRPPYYTNSLDLSFEIITSQTNTVPPETNTVADKWLQIPDTSTNGLDVRVTDPKILADDFLCNATGPITQIRIWTSWLNDQLPPQPPCICIGLWTDNPADTNLNFYSRPNVQLCNWCFYPGQYTYFPYTNGVFERFWDPNLPGTNGLIGSDTVIWEYIFNIPTNVACWQTNGNVYWLSVTADCFDQSQFLFGWKTSPTNWNDDAVFGHTAGFNNPIMDWQELRRPPYYTNSLDLAFQIITETNPCQLLAIACPLDKIVECGSVWTNDPPVVNDPCCGTNYTLTYTAITNGTCPQVITFYSVVNDCVGNVAACSQTVTVVDTTPPIVSCAPDKNVECGTAWTFDSPTAYDQCCGTNVTITVLSTITNASPCPTVITRTWQIADCCTNVVNCSQTVTVVDTTPPTITCSTNIIVYTCDSNTVVSWSISASDTCGSVTVASSPPSGTAFLPNSTNTVTATATDACGNTNACTFTVAVRRLVLSPIFISYLATNKVVLTWTNGILTVATNVIGPYVDVPGATSPYTNTTLPPPPTNAFYRVRCY